MISSDINIVSNTALNLKVHNLHCKLPKYEEDENSEATKQAPPTPRGLVVPEKGTRYP